MVHDVVIGPWCPVEGQEDQAPRIEGRQHGGQHPHPEGVMGERVGGGPGGLQDGVLAVEAGEAEEAGDPETDERQRADPHHGVGDGDLAPDTAHAPHVLLVGHRMDHRPRSEEQERLEEGVRHQVEDAGRIGADAAGEEHVAELRAGRIGDHALDVELRDTDGRGEDAGGGADEGDERQGRRRVLVERREPGDEEDAGRHHGRSVDQRGNGRRPLHCVGQPGMQADLRGLPHGPDEEEEAQDLERPKRGTEDVKGRVRELVGVGEDDVVLHAVEDEKAAGDPERQAEIADAV